MKKYSVVIETPAEINIRESYEWGCRFWGKKQAKQWLRQLNSAIFKQLSSFPESQPIAPENESFAKEIRQLIVGRYRVLFTIQGKKVHVLHIRGAYIGDVEAEIDED